MADRLYRRGRVYWGWYYPQGPGGPQERKSTGCTDRRAALEVLRSWEQEAAVARSDPHHTKRREATLKQAFDLLIANRSEKARIGKGAQETVTFYEQKSANWLAFLGEDFPLARLDAPEVDRYVSSRRMLDDRTGKPFASEHTIHKELTALRAALKLAKRARLWRGDIGEIIEPGFSTSYEPRTRFLRDMGEVRSLLRAFELEGQAHRGAIVAYAIATGAERRALLRARRSDLDDRKLVPLHGTKRKTREREVPNVTSWQRELLAYVRRHADGTDGLLFSVWNNYLRGLARACTRAKIDRVTLNDLRRTYGVWMRREGMASDLVAPTMGHRDSRMVETVYGRLAGSDLRDRMQNVIDIREAAKKRARRPKRKAAGA